MQTGKSSLTKRLLRLVKADLTTVKLPQTRPWNWTDRSRKAADWRKSPGETKPIHSEKSENICADGM